MSCFCNDIDKCPPHDATSQYYRLPFQEMSNSSLNVKVHTLSCTSTTCFLMVVDAFECFFFISRYDPQGPIEGERDLESSTHHQTMENAEPHQGAG